MKKPLLFCLVLLVLLATAWIAGCIFPAADSQPQPIAGNGTILLVPGEKDLYSLVSETGVTYYPLSLPSSFRSNGMPVAYTIQVNKSVAVAPATGTPVDVIELVALSPPGSLIGATGTIRYVDLEGGFYGITVDKGTQYGKVDFFPINLDDSYKVNNSRVMFAGVPQRDIMTTVMWGIPVQIVEIETI